MNWAGIHNLPLVCVIENNHYAISVPTREEVAGRIADRAHGYGFPGHLIDGNDPFQVLDTMKTAVARARAGEGPTLIEAETYRYYAHTSDDNDALYRSREEVERWRKKDPVARLKQYLIENRLLTEAREAEIDAGVVDLLARAVEDAEAAANPDEPMARVYARVIEPGPATRHPEPTPEGETVNLITAINKTLHEIFERHDDTVLFGEDVARRKGGVFKATEGLTERFGAERCFNTPIAESSIIVREAGESQLIELMNVCQSRFPQIKVFSLPRLEPDRHIELGARGAPVQVQGAIAALKQGVSALGFACTESRGA
jgi:hypothetical protein